MTRFLSSSLSELGEDSASADIRLLPDKDLMGIWEQTQVAMAVIEAKGGYAVNAHAYETAVLIEMQRRMSLLDAGQEFGNQPEAGMPEQGDAMPGVLVLQA